jgi:hypothetical protein
VSFPFMILLIIPGAMYGWVLTLHPRVLRLLVQLERCPFQIVGAVGEMPVLECWCSIYHSVTVIPILADEPHAAM